MGHDWQALAVVAILGGTTLVRATFGFGDGLIAMPLLAMLLGLSVATPLFALVTATIALTLVIRHWREVRLAGAGRLVAGSALGVPFGLWLLRGSFERELILLLAAVVIGFALFQLLRPRPARLRASWTAYPVGLLAGVLGGTYNTNGPPVVIYGTLRRWPPGVFRATLQGYFICTAVVILSGHALAGLWTARVWWLFGVSLLGVLPAIAAGEWLHRRIPTARFERAIYILLIPLGTLLAVDALTT
jgi:hypothetical protein